MAPLWRRSSASGNYKQDRGKPTERNQRLGPLYN
nr:MAG TPA: hypothetical protein [Caudoviricetes sp.]